MYTYTLTQIHNIHVGGQALEGHARWTEITEERSKALGKSQGKLSQKQCMCSDFVIVNELGP